MTTPHTNGSDDSNGTATLARKPRSKEVLPSARIRDEKVRDVLLAYASASTGAGAHDPKPVTNGVLADILEMASTTISTLNPFLLDIGLVVRGTGGNTPVEEVLEFARANEWSPATAGHRLRPVIAEAWFAKALMHKLGVRKLSEEEAIADLAEKAQAGPECKGQLQTLLYMLELAGIVTLADGHVTLVRNGREHEQNDENRDRRTADQRRTTQEREDHSNSKPPFGLMGEQGAVNFSVQVKVDLKELANWKADRISAFFGGLAQVLAARGKEDKAE